MRRALLLLGMGSVVTPSVCRAEPVLPEPSTVDDPWTARDAYSERYPEGLQAAGFVQAQAAWNQLSEDQLLARSRPANQDRFSVRRGRVNLSYGWEYAAAALELDASTEQSVRVRTAEATLLYRSESDPSHEPPLLALSLGVSDLPVGWELAESTRERLLLERSLGSLALFPRESDVGARGSFSYGPFRLAVSLVNGTDSADEWAERNAHKDLLGRVGIDSRGMSSRMRATGGVSFAVGEGFHAGTDEVKDSIQWIDDNRDGLVQPTEVIGVPGRTATPSRNFDRWCFGLDLGLHLRTQLGESSANAELLVASNFDRGYAVADPVIDGVDARELAFATSLEHRLMGYGAVGVRLAFYDPNADLIESRRGQLLPHDQRVWVLSPVLAIQPWTNVRLSAQYDWVRDSSARDARGVPTDAANDQFTLRLQVGS